MTVSMQITKRIYKGNGVTRRWDVDFPLASPEDLRIYLTSPQGAETEVFSDFTLNEARTELTYPALSSGKEPLAEGWSITLARQTPLTQEIDLLRQGELDAEVLEDGYDKLTLIVQELDEKISRSIKYPVSSRVDDLETENFLKNILNIKQETITASSAAVESSERAQISASSAQQTASEALGSISASLDEARTQISQEADRVCSSLDGYISSAQKQAERAEYYALRTIGKTAGEVYYSQSKDASDNPGALPLFTGETIASADTVYPDFYAWVQKHPELQCGADEYEAALSEFGECPKYVLSGGSLRLPLLKNYVKMANAGEGIAQSKAGLPNIEGKLGYYDDNNITSGAVYSKKVENSKAYSFYTLNNTSQEVYLDASRSSPVYGKTDTVTPAHTTLYPWVFAYNEAVPASTAAAAEFQNALSGKMDLPAGKTQADVDYVVDSYSDDKGNWYRVYKSGWVAQGGVTAALAGSTKQVVNFLRPMANTVYSTNISSSPSGPYTGCSVVELTTTSMAVVNTSQAVVQESWRIEGQGAE